MNDPTRHRPGNYTPETLYGMNHIAKVATTQTGAALEAVIDARDVLEGLCDDEIKGELLPRLNAAIGHFRDLAEKSA